MTCHIYLMNIHSITYACKHTRKQYSHSYIHTFTWHNLCTYHTCFPFLICNLLRLLMLLHIHFLSYINSYSQTIINKYIAHIWIYIFRLYSNISYIFFDISMFSSHVLILTCTFTNYLAFMYIYLFPLGICMYISSNLLGYINTYAQHMLKSECTHNFCPIIITCNHCTHAFPFWTN